MAGFNQIAGQFFWIAKMLYLALCTTLGLASVGVIGMGAVAAESGRRSAPNAPIAFDLPAQPLVSALESYSIASGWQVIYDADLATGRRSADVKGAFAPTVALRMLLTGTGLMPQYMAADGVMLVPDPATADARPITPGDSASRFRSYYGRIQTELKRAFCADRRIRSGRYRIALGFWIGSSGAVRRTTALGSTGNAEIDEAFDRAVRSLSIGDPPPAGFDQPVVILVTPDLVGQCDTVDTGTRPVRTGP